MSDYNGEDMPVPKSQQDAMMTHLSNAEAEAKAKIRGARTQAERDRGMSDLEGVQVMKDRVMREWNVK